ncbi:MAG: hypothetical protein AAFN11_12945, partial [Chloroflexota bacterium]
MTTQNPSSQTENTAPATSLDTQKRLRIVGISIVAVLIAGGLLLADLYYRGLIWQYAYQQTGEESIAGQLQGMVEVAGNLIRPQPNLQRMTPIEHTDVFPYGINTFFEQETEIDKMNVQFQMIREAGFGWIRQEFPWEDLEVDGRGQFTDTRVDYDGDGEPDTIDAWEKYDRIVDLADEYDLQMIVRLSNPPNWSREENFETLAGPLAPPDDYQDFVNYAVAVAERYQGRIQYFQVWNEPNIYPEWGENPVSPADYTRMLCMTYEALKAVDPDIVVISGTIAPTDSLDGYFGYHDLAFIQVMYDNGAAECFDVLSAQGYGLNSGPTDRRRRVTYLSYARHVLYRDLMVANGDAEKAIWLSEVAWNPTNELCLQTGECLAPEEVAGVYNFGAVTNEQAARYLPEAYERAREEWSWIGHLSYWHFTRPTIEEADQAFYWFRMVEADYSPEDPTFTPLPVYNSAQDYLTGLSDELPIVYVGTHQAESWDISLPETAVIVADADAEFSEAVETQSITFQARGSDITVRLNSSVPVVITQNGSVISTLDATNGWQTALVTSNFTNTTSTYELSASQAFLV